MINFIHNKYIETTFTNLDMPATHIDQVSFQDCVFTSCNWMESTIKECRFERCQFSQCDLSLIKLPGSILKTVKFKDCRLMGINWNDANWSTESLLFVKHVDFESCLLDHSLFIGLDLTETSFVNCRARNLDFEGANLTKTNFSGADLLESRFIQCDLTETNFTHAVNYRFDAAHNILHKTRFTMPEAITLLYGLDIIIEE